MSFDLMTEDEVAAVLRCNVAKIRRLRLTGRLTYLPGRPVLIDRKDLETFVEAEKRRLAERSPDAIALRKKAEKDAAWERRTLFKMMNRQDGMTKRQKI